MVGWRAMYLRVWLRTSPNWNIDGCNRAVEQNSAIYRD